jgi:hypothetical protein
MIHCDTLFVLLCNLAKQISRRAAQGSAEFYRAGVYSGD